jgi:hypothetical protein
LRLGIGTIAPGDRDDCAWKSPVENHEVKLLENTISY